MGGETNMVPQDVVTLKDESLAMIKTTWAEIVSPEHFVEVGAVVKEVTKRRKALQEKHKDLSAPFKEGLDKLKEFFKDPIDRLKEAEGHLRGLVEGYTAEQERKRLEEQNKINAENRARDERRQAALERRAEKAREAGNEEKAAEIEEKKEAIFTPSVELESSVPKADGVSTRTIWRAEVVDVNKLPRAYMLPNLALLSQEARLYKGKKNVDGVRFYSEQSSVVRS